VADESTLRVSDALSVRSVASKRPTPPAGKSNKEASLTGRIDINRASREELQQLPGIGPKLSQRIVDERQRGRFETVEELRRVPGIGPKTMDKLRSHVSVDAEGLRIVTAE
jgi:comEA protein